MVAAYVPVSKVRGSRRDGATAPDVLSSILAGMVAVGGRP